MAGFKDEYLPITKLGPVGSNEIVYDDFQVDLGRVRLGATAPTWRQYNYGTAISFDVLGFAVNDYIYFTIQTSHKMKLNTPLYLHYHYVLPNTTNIGNNFKFQVDIVAGVPNEQFTALSGSPFTAEETVAANDNTYHRITSLVQTPAINTKASTMYLVKLTRVAASADEYGSEVYLISIDAHYQIDTLGSEAEYVK